MSLKEQILQLKKEKNAIILAHFYQTPDILEVADIVGDSFELARRARDAKEQVILLCGVRFMAESAKILNPDKTVLHPQPLAGCPMADMIDAPAVVELKKKHPGAVVVCYVNSSAAVKAESHICCTSSSAVKIVKAIPEKDIIFIPDKNLGAYVAEQVPEKNIILYDGFCPIHNQMTTGDVQSARAAHPGAKFIAHPECVMPVLELADFVGSTAAIIDYAKNSDAKEFIIGTEVGVIEWLKRLCPDKIFHPLSQRMFCINMKKNTIQDVYDSLAEMKHEVEMSQGEIQGAYKSLDAMVNAI